MRAGVHERVGGCLKAGYQMTGPASSQRCTASCCSPLLFHPLVTNTMSAQYQDTTEEEIDVVSSHS